jgi:hypothetical protein
MPATSAGMTLERRFDFIGTRRSSFGSLIDYRQNEARDPADRQTQKIRVRDFFAKLTD